MSLRGFLIAASFVGLATGCNYTDGQCYARGQGGLASGAGGQPVVVGGPGGFGDVPPPPQGADEPTPPDCNIVPQTPCYEKCLADYEASAGKCGEIANEAQKKTCQDAAYAAYKACRDSCQQQQKTCTDMYVDCQSRGDPCTRIVEGRKTLCAACQDDCLSDRPYKFKDCRKCGFE